MGKKGKTVAAILGGAAIGAGLGILFAPKSGKETRAELKAKMDDLISKAKEGFSKKLFSEIILPLILIMVFPS